MIYGLLTPLAAHFPRTQRFLSKLPIGKFLFGYTLLWFVGGIALVALGLAGCENEPKAHAKYVSDCSESGFNQKQCEVLYKNYRSSRDAEGAAAVAAGFAGFSAGASGSK